MNRTLTASISDPSGVPTAGVGLPVLYWRKNAGSYNASQGVFVSGSSYNFLIDYSGVGGVVAGDSISYYVAAQDSYVTPNVSVFPAAGASGLTANPPTASTPPTTPSSYLIATAVSGSYNVGTGQTLTSITNAGGLFDFINNNVLTGNVTVNITSNLTAETGAVALNQWSEEGTGGYTLLIKPSAGPGARTVSGTTGLATNALVKLNGADRVTIDGSKTGGTDRNLTISTTGTTGAVVWIASASASNGANNNTIKNCNIAGTDSTNTIVDVIAGSGATLGNAADAPNSNNTIQNNVMIRAQNSIYISGFAGTLDQSWTITGNTMGSATVAEKMSFRGMLIGSAQNFAITNNTILGIISTTSSTASGIQIAFAVNGGTISGNRISDIKNTNSGGWGSNALLLSQSSATANVTASNNFMWDIASVGFNGVDVADNGYGIVVASGGGYKIYANSVALTTDQGASAASGITAAINILAAVTGAGAVDLRDNILANLQTLGTRYAVYDASTASVFSTINNNDYSAPNVGFLTSARVTLANWQAATGQDAQSVSGNPLFVSSTDLHINTSGPLSPAENAGQPLAAVTNDIDNDPRNPSFPDIGADEVTRQTDLSLTKVGNSSVTESTNITYTITVTNNGPDVATSPSWSDTTPAGTTFVSITPPAGWTCGNPAPGGTGLISCSAATLGNGASAIFTLVLRTDCVVTTINNSATVANAAGDPTPANNTGSQATLTTACNDSNTCTNDTCTLPTGCIFTPVTDGTFCGDAGTDCIVQDTCQSGVCQDNGFVPANTGCTTDGNQCTHDVCNGAGTCTHNNESDGFPCGSNADTDCDNPDSCLSGVCQNNYEPAGHACSDGLVCTTGDNCNATGSCVGTGTLNCDDGTSCTTDNCVEPTGCTHTTSGTCDINGTVRYYRDNVGPAEPSMKGIPNEDVTRTSSSEPTSVSTTNAAGQYDFQDESGTITLTPTAIRLMTDENECHNSITAADATLDAQASVGVGTPFTTNQRLAGDVSNNGTISAYDAALIAQKAVANPCLTHLPHFPVRDATGSDWAFRPVSRTYLQLMGGEDYSFLGILYGDPSGNWTAPVLFGQSVEEKPQAPSLEATEETTLAESSIGIPTTVFESGIAEMVTAQGQGGATLYVAGAPVKNADGTYSMVFGLQSADGILGLDLVLKYDATIQVLGVSTTGIASTYTAAGGKSEHGYGIGMFGVNALQGAGDFLKVTYSVTGNATGMPFSVAAQANEGQIPIRWSGVPRTSGSPQIRVGE